MRIKTEGPPDANIMVLGEAPGKEESECGRPFVGRAGQTLNKLLGIAGVQRSECLLSNVAKEKPPGGKIDFYFKDKKCMHPTPQLQTWISELMLEIDTYQPNVIIAFGRTALWALTGLSGIKAHRGFVTNFTTPRGRVVKVVPTYHPQAVSYDWSLASTVVRDIQKAKYHSQDTKIPEDRRTLIANATKNEFLDYCDDMIDQGCPLAYDIETSQPGSHINRFGLAHSPDFGISIPIIRSRKSIHSASDEVEIMNALANVFDNNPIIMHNAPYDTSMTWRNYHIPVKYILMDTQVAAHILYVEQPKALTELASLYLDVPSWKHTSSLSPGMYNAADCTNTYGLFEFFDVELSKKGLKGIYKHEMRQLEPVMYMMLNGLQVDLEVRDELLIQERTKVVEAESKMVEIIGHSVNYNSPKQMANLLYVELDLPIQFKRRKSKDEPRKMTTDSEAIDKLLRETNHPYLKWYKQAKKASKNISSFIDVKTSKEGKVFTSYNVTGTTSGRWSSSKSIIDPFGPGNLQNQPEEARRLYRAPPNYKWVRADYVQAEAVAVAYFSQDRVLMKLFKDSFGMAPSERKKGYDVHRYTASTMFNIPIEDINGEQRRVGKTLRHACNYSAGPAVIAKQLGIKMTEGRNLLNIYFDRNPFLKIWHKRIEAELRATRMLLNPFGRIRRFLDRWGDGLLRSAYSFKPQSTIGDMMGKAISDFYYDYGDDFDIKVQLHDAFYVVVPEKDVDIVMNCMRKSLIFPVTIDRETMYVDADFAVGDSWGEMEEVDRNWTDFDAAFINKNGEE